MKRTFCEDLATALTGVDSSATSQFLQVMMTGEKEWAAVSAFWAMASEEEKEALWGAIGLEQYRGRAELPKGLVEMADRMMTKASEILGE